MNNENNIFDNKKSGFMLNFNNNDSMKELQTILMLQEGIINNLDAQLISANEDSNHLHAKHLEYEHHIKTVYQQLQLAHKQVESLKQSTIWRVTAPLRDVLEKHPFLSRNIKRVLKVFYWSVTFQLFKKLRQHKQTIKYFANQILQSANIEENLIIPNNRNKLQVVFFISGEPDTPGHYYRIERYAAAAKTAGYGVIVSSVDKVTSFFNQITSSTIIFIWRAMWCDNLALLYQTAKSIGSKVVFDIDDFLFEPRFATSTIIDGIRTLNFTEEFALYQSSQLHRTLNMSNAASAPTVFLAAHLRRYALPAFVLPNGFDHEILVNSRLAVRLRRQLKDDGIIRIGYAAGTFTHQRDFAQAASSIVKILHEYSNCRLVLFCSDNAEIFDLNEFREFQGLEHQIEWRSTVPLIDLPAEISRFDINIAPLEWDNVFCNAKSELKYFEAALVEVPTIASPTNPYARAINQGVTGFLARSPDEWYKYLKLLIENVALRQSIATAAYHAVLWTYSPERRVQLINSFVEQLSNDPQRVANAFELELTRGQLVAESPQIADYQIIFENDKLQSSPITVVIVSYNHARYLEEALESVKAQTYNNLDLVVIDDKSTDNSLAIADSWLRANTQRFNRIILAQNGQNAGLSLTRNLGFTLAESLYVLPLEASNKLHIECLEVCFNAVDLTPAAFAYPYVQEFANENDVMGLIKFHPALFISINYINSMALIRKTTWIAVGGYLDSALGYEDYEFWCKCVKFGFFGTQIPRILAYCRKEANSILPTMSKKDNDILQNRHSWLYLDTLEV